MQTKREFFLKNKQTNHAFDSIGQHYTTVSLVVNYSLWSEEALSKGVVATDLQESSSSLLYRGLAEAEFLRASFSGGHQFITMCEHGCCRLYRGYDGHSRDNKMTTHPFFPYYQAKYGSMREISNDWELLSRETNSSIFAFLGASQRLCSFNHHLLRTGGDVEMDRFDLSIHRVTGPFIQSRCCPICPDSFHLSLSQFENTLQCVFQCAGVIPSQSTSNNNNSQTSSSSSSSLPRHNERISLPACLNLVDKNGHFWSISSPSHNATNCRSHLTRPSISSTCYFSVDDVCQIKFQVYEYFDLPKYSPARSLSAMNAKIISCCQKGCCFEYIASSRFGNSNLQLIMDRSCPFSPKVLANSDNFNKDVVIMTLSNGAWNAEFVSAANAYPFNPPNHCSVYRELKYNEDDLYQIFMNCVYEKHPAEANQHYSFLPFCLSNVALSNEEVLSSVLDSNLAPLSFKQLLEQALVYTENASMCFQELLVRTQDTKEQLQLINSQHCENTTGVTSQWMRVLFSISSEVIKYQKALTILKPHFQKKKQSHTLHHTNKQSTNLNYKDASTIISTQNNDDDDDVVAVTPEYQMFDECKCTKKQYETEPGEIVSDDEDDDEFSLSISIPDSISSVSKKINIVS